MLSRQALFRHGRRPAMGSRRCSTPRRRSTSSGVRASTRPCAPAGRRTPSPRRYREADVRLSWLLVGLGSVVVVVVLIAATLGAYGPLVVCGADGAAVCVMWPGWISGATWVLFVGFFIGLATWQVRAWRGSG